MEYCKTHHRPLFLLFIVGALYNRDKKRKAKLFFLMATSLRLKKKTVHGQDLRLRLVRNILNVSRLVSFKLSEEQEWRHCVGQAAVSFPFLLC